VQVLTVFENLHCWSELRTRGGTDEKTALAFPPLDYDPVGRDDLHVLSQLHLFSLTRVMRLRCVRNQVFAMYRPTYVMNHLTFVTNHPTYVMNHLTFVMNRLTDVTNHLMIVMNRRSYVMRLMAAFLNRALESRVEYS